MYGVKVVEDKVTVTSKSGYFEGKCRVCGARIFRRGTQDKSTFCHRCK